MMGMGSMIAGGIKGTAAIAGGIIGGGKRRREQKAAQAEFDSNKQQMMGLDTSNLAANMDNAYEDLTVNTQQADFMAQQNQAQSANIMSGLAGAAGGSGIAALAQTMANQGAQQAQQASASIGAQESANQQAMAQGAMANQAASVAGAGSARSLQYQKTQKLMGMASDRLGAANDARAQAKASVMSGIGQMADSGGAALDTGLISDRKLKENIKLIGYSQSGLKVYAFEYINKAFGEGTWQGVMSDEIPQYAVIKHEDGFDRVDYSKLDVKFKQIQNGIKQ